MAGLEDVVEHSVVEGRDGARVLAVDRGEDAVHLVVRPEPDALEADVGLEDEYGHLGTVVRHHSVDVTDDATPVVVGRQASVSGDLHFRALPRRFRIIL